jgi:hypothetical protein
VQISIFCYLKTSTDLTKQQSLPVKMACHGWPQHFAFEKSIFWSLEVSTSLTKQQSICQSEWSTMDGPSTLPSKPSNQ